MVRLAGDTLTAVGRMTVAATELEHTLAALGAGPDATAEAVFAQPGAALRAARAAAGRVPPADRQEYVGAVEGAGTQLAVSQAALRAMWRPGARTDAAMFDEITVMLLRCRDVLHRLARSDAA
ncbi:hypothetical protein ACIBPB_17070 [Micromonospora sp. NPDC049836]|uniref:hypothetical protein n=1 Tax=Micromonospora sp. NPDC049836 TaxID=3364274 RepID=UPI0037A5C4B7